MTFLTNTNVFSLWYGVIVSKLHEYKLTWCGTVVCELRKKTIVSEVDSHWVPHTSGLGPIKLSKVYINWYESNIKPASKVFI